MFWDDLVLLALDVIEPDIVACGGCEQLSIEVLVFLFSELFWELLESNDWLIRLAVLLDCLPIVCK